MLFVSSSYFLEFKSLWIESNSNVKVQYTGDGHMDTGETAIRLLLKEHTLVS